MRLSIRKLSAALVIMAVAACGSGEKAGVDPYALKIARPGKPNCIKTTNAVNEFAAEIVNRPRSMVGLPPIAPHQKLAASAEKHACDMAARGVLSYVGGNSKNPQERVQKRHYDAQLVAESITAGPYNLEGVLDNWNSTPQYLKNSLTPGIRHFGIGHAVAADGETHFWTAVYAAPK